MTSIISRGGHALEDSDSDACCTSHQLSRQLLNYHLFKVGRHIEGELDILVVSPPPCQYQHHYNPYLFILTISTVTHLFKPTISVAPYLFRPTISATPYLFKPTINTTHYFFRHIFSLGPYFFRPTISTILYLFKPTINTTSYLFRPTISAY
ncbi:hypothetical protein AAG906_039284 [Vitis piasezkii]